MRHSSLGLLIVAAALLACPASSLGVVRISGPAPVATFSAQPSNISIGDTVVLTWSATDAYGATIQPGIGWVAASGTLSTTARETTTPPT